MNYTEIPKDEPEKKWPWWLYFIKPHQGSTKNDYVVRCGCGRAMWLHSSPNVQKHHIGCKQEVITDGTMWEFFKMKTGLLRFRTLNECFKDLMEGRF